jgi:hypothetical protein
MRANVPFGILKVNHRLSQEEFARLKATWESAMSGWGNGQRSTIILEQGIDFIPLDTQMVPDAFCIYCGLANLQTSFWCHGCGAPLVRQSRPIGESQ